MRNSPQEAENAESEFCAGVEIHRFESAVQFRTTVIAEELCVSTGMLMGKRCPSGKAPYRNISAKNTPMRMIRKRILASIQKTFYYSEHNHIRKPPRSCTVAGRSRNATIGFRPRLFHPRRFSRRCGNVTKWCWLRVPFFMRSHFKSGIFIRFAKSLNRGSSRRELKGI